MSRGPRHPFALWGTVLVLLVSVTATARPMLQSERIVDALTRPVSETSKADWLAMGPPLATNKHLVELATGKGLPRIYQLRALEVLPFFPTKQSMQVLWEVVYDRDTDDVRRKVALRSLGAGWQSEVLHDLISFLDEQSETLREGAVMGIGLIDDPRVTTLLENRLYREETIRVRLAIEKALQQSRQYDLARDRRDAENIFEQPVRVFPPGFSPTLPKEPPKGRANQPQR